MREDSCTTNFTTLLGLYFIFKKMAWPFLSCIINWFVCKKLQENMEQPLHNKLQQIA